MAVGYTCEDDWRRRTNESILELMAVGHTCEDDWRRRTNGRILELKALLYMCEAHIGGEGGKMVRCNLEI